MSEEKTINLSVNALAEKLGYNPNYVRWLAQKKKIPGRKVLGQWRFNLQAVIDSSTPKATHGSGNGPQHETETSDLLS